MDRLRTLFEELAFEDVSTLIASGNVIFSADSDDVDSLIDAIEGHLERELGYEVATFLRTPAQLAEVSAVREEAEEASAASSPSHYVMFLKTPPPEPLCLALADLNSETDAFEISNREIHWRIQGKLSESPLFGSGIDRVTRGVPMTVRNMNTVRRLVVKTSFQP